MIPKPKRSLGQNFLIDQNIVDLIIEKGEIKKNDIIVEVGPGTGNLTEKIILKNPKKIILIEKDKILANKLNIKFKEKIILINEDILKVNEAEFKDDKMIFFGNLPYNISSQILVKWIRRNDLNILCKKMILMFQKEVADRILAQTNHKEYGRLSILSSWKLNVTKIKDINPGSFYPKPKVKSSILLIEPKENIFKINNPKNLEHITNVFFSQKRKMINKPLKILFKDINKITKKFNLDISKRPQNLNPSIYFNLCKEYEDLN
tara:strand:- start:898 stop:1686 length:789 start_codon:yes stop_codon:yes gene_type:complete